MPPQMCHNCANAAMKFYSSIVAIKMSLMMGVSAEFFIQFEWFKDLTYKGNFKVVSMCSVFLNP